MGKGKPRHKPNKPQNNYGGDYNCPNYDTLPDGKEFCHDEGQGNWDEFIKWSMTDKQGNFVCKGNRHKCLSLKLKWLSSLNDKKREIGKQLKNIPIIKHLIWED